MSRTLTIVIALGLSLAQLGCGLRKAKECRAEVVGLRMDLQPLVRHYQRPSSTWPITVPRELVLDAGEPADVDMVVSMTTDSLVVGDERIGDVIDVAQLQTLMQQHGSEAIGFRISERAPWAAVVAAIAAADAIDASVYLIGLGPSPDPEAAELAIAKQLAEADKTTRDHLMRVGPSLELPGCAPAKALFDEDGDWMENPSVMLSALPDAIEGCGCEQINVRNLSKLLRAILAPEHGNVGIELQLRATDATVVRLAEHAEFREGVAQLLAAAPKVRLEVIYEPEPAAAPL